MRLKLGIILATLSGLTDSVLAVSCQQGSVYDFVCTSHSAKLHNLGS
jgi:hypothetical protein